VLQEMGRILADQGKMRIRTPGTKTFEEEGELLCETLTESFEKRRSDLAELADAARRVERVGFGAKSGFAQASFLTTRPRQWCQRPPTVSL
jgi:hypothetical protein